MPSAKITRTTVEMKVTTTSESDEYPSTTHYGNNFTVVTFVWLLIPSEADGEREHLEDHDIKSKSKTTQAIKLFSELNSPVEVAIALNLPVNQVPINILRILGT